MPLAACPPVSKGVPRSEGAWGPRRGFDAELVGTLHPGRPWLDAPHHSWYKHGRDGSAGKYTCYRSTNGKPDRKVLSPPPPPPPRGSTAANDPAPGINESTAFSIALRRSLTPGSGSPCWAHSLVWWVVAKQSSHLVAVLADLTK